MIYRCQNVKSPYLKVCKVFSESSELLVTDTVLTHENYLLLGYYVLDTICEPISFSFRMMVPLKSEVKCLHTAAVIGYSIEYIK